MTDILGANPTIWNNQAGGFGIAKLGNPNDGHINQYNQGKADKVDIGASKNGSERIIFTGDNKDTFNLTGGWTNKGYTTSNGISGQLFTSKTGDQILISAPIGATLTGDYTGKIGGPLTLHSSDPAATTAPGTVISSVAPPSKDYTQNIVNYAKQFENQQGKFSAENLSKLYGFQITDKTIKNLDLDGKNGIDLNEAVAGLAFEDNNGAKADGKISSDDINNTKSLFEQSVQGRDNEVNAKIGANKDSISRIATALDLQKYTGS